MAAPTVVANKDGTFNVWNQKFSSQQWANKAVAARSQLKKYATTPIVSQWKTKQQYLDESVKAGNVSVDKWWNIISKAWVNIWNTSEFQWSDMAKTFDKTKWKYVEQTTPTPTDWTEWVITPTPEDTTTQTDQTQQQSQTWPQESTSQPWANQQWVVSGNIWWANFWETKQQYLDKKIASWEVRMDQWWNIVNNKSWQVIGNINWVDMTQSAIWQTQPNANAEIQQQQANIQWNKDIDQQKINNIKPDVSLWLSNSPDSPFWNSFWQAWVDAENQLPWFLNERNKVIASWIMLNNSNIKFMSEAKRKDLILKDIIDRQEWWIDPNIEWRYSKTVDNINNLINREIPAYNSDDYFKMIVDGWKIDYNAATWNPELRSARLRFNNLQQYSSMDVNWLTQAIKEWKLNKWWQLWNDLLNKGMWNMLDSAYSSYNMQTQSAVTSYVQWEVSSFSTDKSLESQASTKIDLWTGLDAQISEKIISLMTEDKIPTLASFLAADPDVQDAKKASKATEEEINKLSDEITAFADNIKEKVVEQWWEATDDPFLDAYIQEKTKPFVKRLTQLNGKYRNEIAMLEDASENARTAFEVKEYNKQSEIQWYQFVLWRLDKQKAEETAAKATAQAQSNREKSFWLQQQQFELSKAQTEANIAKIKSETETPTSNWVQTWANNRSSINIDWFDYKVWSTAPWRLWTIWSGKITQLWWDTNTSWLDIDWKIWDELTSPFEWTVSRFWTDKTGNKYVEIQDANWNKLLFNHLSSIWSYQENDLKVWQKISSWQAIWLMGNSGNTKWMNWWDGSHLDLVWFKSDWSRMTIPEIMQFGNNPSWYKWAEDSISIDNVTSYNDKVERREMSADEVNRIWAAKKEVMNNPDSSISDIMARSEWWKAIWDTQSKSLVKFDQAMSQLEAITKQIDWMKTWPIIWSLRNMNPRDTDANVLKAQLQWLVPTIARGIYWEVWVLTDNDVKLYAQTLPTLKWTKAINNWVLAVTLDVLAWWYKNTLTSLAWQWYDVSWLEWTYVNIKRQADQLRELIWMNEVQNTTSSVASPQWVWSLAPTIQQPKINNPYSRMKQ